MKKKKIEHMFEEWAREEMWKLWIMWTDSRHKICILKKLSKNVKQSKDYGREEKYYVNENIHNLIRQVMHKQIVDMVDNYFPSSASPIK